MGRSRGQIYSTDISIRLKHYYIIILYYLFTYYIYLYNIICYIIINNTIIIIVFENTILRRIFGTKRDENGEWRRLHNEELHILYRSPIIVRVIKLRWAGHVARMEDGRSAFKILTRAPAEVPPLGGPRRRWEEHIRMDLKEIGINMRNWVDSAGDRDYWGPTWTSAFHTLWS